MVAMKLPVDESLRIRKNRVMPTHPTGEEKRIAVVTGTHGDELEGQFVCYELLRRLKAEPEGLKGIVDVYPALNPLGIDSITRGIPMFDLDMNRIFPGNDEGPMMESLVCGLTEDLKGADLCVDIHASNIFLMNCLRCGSMSSRQRNWSLWHRISMWILYGACQRYRAGIYFGLQLKPGWHPYSGGGDGSRDCALQRPMDISLWRDC